MLNYAEAVGFVKDKLCILYFEDMLRTSRYELLCQITLRLHEQSPFHNFWLMSQDPDQRRRPSWEEVKSRMYSGAGGLCYTRNLFAFHLLRGLGYRVKLTMAYFRKGPNLTHVMINVFDLREIGDSFLVDVGFAWPAFEPVDLGFDSESDTFSQSYLNIKFRKDSGNLIRLQAESDQSQELQWQEVYLMSNNLYEPEEIHKFFDVVYQTPGCTHFHSVLSCVSYTARRCTMLTNDKLKVENQNGQMEKCDEGDGQSLVDCIKERFPSLGSTIVERAIDNWRSLKRA